MKKITALLFACMFTAGICGAAFADCGEEGCGDGKGMKWMEKRHDKMLGKMEKELGLTQEQKDKISAIMKETGEKMKAEMEKARETHKAMRDASEQQIKAVLTPEQALKYDKIKQDKKEKMHKKMKKMKKK